ncbi:MAG: GNAT family N-acetyltransferase [Actinomycetota bacterium]|nr:GNAT family N-acetyltransferase [Actinomycetota bacterium]
MPKARLGVALLLPPPLAAEVDGLRRALGDGGLSRIPAHLTLVPPVNVRHDRLGHALAVLREAAAATRPFSLLLGPPDTFLPHSPVVYLRVGGDGGAVGDLRDRVFREPLARSLTWPFVPHVTLADEAAPARIEAALTALDRYGVEASFDRVHLLRELPGRVWEPVADAAFTAPAVIGRGGLPLELSVSEHLDPEAAALAARACPDADPDPQGEAGRAERPFAVTARRDGRVVGAATGHTHGDQARLAQIVVAVSERGEGIGTHLLGVVASLAAERGCRFITALAAVGSPPEGFFRARGWVRNRDFVELRRDL